MIEGAVHRLRLIVLSGFLYYTHRMDSRVVEDIFYIISLCILPSIGFSEQLKFRSTPTDIGVLLPAFLLRFRWKSRNDPSCMHIQHQKKEPPGRKFNNVDTRQYITARACVRCRSSSLAFLPSAYEPDEPLSSAWADPGGCVVGVCKGADAYTILLLLLVKSARVVPGA